MPHQKNNAAIAAGLLLAVLFWGANNAGTKWLVATWPPVWTGSVRFLLAGVILLGVLKFTGWFGAYQPLGRDVRRRLFLRCGLSLAVYIILFCWALKLIPASHVALYLGASPVWALLMEDRPRWDMASLRRYAAALLAVAGVVVLFWPALGAGRSSLPGECLGFFCGLLWATYSLQVRVLSRDVAGVEVAAHSMWMAGALLLPVGLLEVVSAGALPLDLKHLGIQAFCIVFGGAVPYTLWNGALRHWPTSRVMLFNNFIPISTTTWAFFLLGEPLSSHFFAAMALIVAGVLLGQMDWSKFFKQPEGI